MQMNLDHHEIDRPVFLYKPNTTRYNSCDCLPDTTGPLCIPALSCKGSSGLCLIWNEATSDIKVRAISAM